MLHVHVQVANHGNMTYDPIKRPAQQPAISFIPNIKTKWFCFMSVGSNRITCRERSCYCLRCLVAGKRVHLLPKTGLHEDRRLTHEHTHIPHPSHTGPKTCLNYDTCGPWRMHTVLPNDDEWDKLIKILEKEGRNEQGRWNDYYYGCYDERSS